MSELQIKCNKQDYAVKLSIIVQLLLQNLIYHKSSIFFGDLFGVQRSGEVMQETMNLTSLVSIQTWSEHPAIGSFIKRWQWRQHRLHGVDVEVAFL